MTAYCTHTHLEGTLLPALLAETLQHLPVDAQAQDLGCDLIVVCHRVPPELRSAAGGRLQLSQAAAQTAALAVGATVVRCPLLRSNRISRLLLLVLILDVIHIFLF